MKEADYLMRNRVAVIAGMKTDKNTGK